MAITNNKLGKGSKITIHYDISWEGNKLVYTTRDDGPVQVTLGESDLLDSLEKAIIENSGNNFTVTLSPEQCYGARNENLIEEVPIESIPVEARIEGARIVATGDDGEERDVLITKVDNNKGTCLVDFNHPLAGKELTFRVEIL